MNDRTFLAALAGTAAPIAPRWYDTVAIVIAAVIVLHLMTPIILERGIR